MSKVCLPDARDPVPFVGGELGDGGDAGPGAELPDLVGAQPWHQGEVVVGDPPLVALRSPLADVAVLDRQRIRRNPVGAGDDEPCLGGTVVGGEVGQPERGPGLVTEHDVDPVSNTTLAAGQLLGVLAQLEDGRRPDVGGELGVLGFVGESSERARCRHPGEEVGMSPPDGAGARPVDEGRLVDHVRPRCECFLGQGRSRLKFVACRDLSDLEALGTESRQIRHLVLDPPALDDRLLLIVVRRPRTGAMDHLERELGQVAALQKADEVARTEDQPSVVNVHPPTSWHRCCHRPGRAPSVLPLAGLGRPSGLRVYRCLRC